MSRIRVGPYDYLMNPVSPDSAKLLIQGKENWATSDHKNLFFNYDETMDGQMQIVCVLHECAHAWEIVSGSHWSEDENDRELICDSIGTLMYQIIRDNPDLCEKIWELSYDIEDEEDETVGTCEDVPTEEVNNMACKKKGKGKK